MKVTILTCTADLSSELFRRHSEALKKYTDQFEWIVLDNNRGSNFNHAAEINRAIKIARGNYLIILDDDLIVTNGWLDALLKETDSSEVVGAVHRNDAGEINHGGGYILPEGWAGHLKTKPSGRLVQYVCSAVMLINLEFARTHSLTFDESFRKYYQEVDFCLKVWENGGCVAISEECDVTHLFGATASGRADKSRLSEDDSEYFKKIWVRSGKLAELMKVNGKSIDAYNYEDILKIEILRLRYKHASESGDSDEFEKIYNESEGMGDFDHGVIIRGGAAYHKGRLDYEDGNKKAAESWFRRCLELIPGHKSASDYLGDC